MVRARAILFSVCCSCSVNLSQSVAELSSCSVADFGAVPDDGIDDRAAIQLAIDGGCAMFSGGEYTVLTPPMPRSIAMLTFPPNTEMYGNGATETVIKFSGDPQRVDWRGIQLNSNAHLHHLTLAVDTPPGSTDEQTHVVRADGPLHDIEIDHTICDNPVVVNSKKGDCYQFVGYEPRIDSPDRTIWNVNIHHNTVKRAARSGVGIHSGIHGTLVGGHYTSRIHNNLFLDTSDQDVDEEGSYLEAGLPSIDGIEIDHNTFEHIPNPLTPHAVSMVYSGHTWFHDNVLNGRGIIVDGCFDCEFYNNTVIQAVPAVVPAVILRRYIVNVTLHDEKYIREESAGVGSVLDFSQLVTGYPLNVKVEDSSLVQRAQGNILYSFGSVGLSVVSTTLDYQRPTETPTFFGIDLSGSAVTRTDNITLRRVSMLGPLKSPVRLNGGYAGAGNLHMEQVTSEAQYGLWCEDPFVGNTILGPVTYTNNTMPLALCPVSLMFY